MSPQSLGLGGRSLMLMGDRSWTRESGLNRSLISNVSKGMEAKCAKTTVLKCGICVHPASLWDALRATLNLNIYKCPGIYAAFRSMSFSLFGSFSKRFNF